MKKKSGLKLDRVIALLNEFRGRIDNFVAVTVNDRRTFEWALERMRQQVYIQREFEKLPEWAKHNLRGYWQGKQDAINAYLTIFAYKHNGELYRVRHGYLKNDWRTWDELQIDMHRRKGRFDPSECECYGSFWPDGSPYSVTVTKQPAELAEAA